MLVENAERRDVGTERFTDDDIQVLEALRDLFGTPDANNVANEAFNAINRLRSRGCLTTGDREVLAFLIGAFIGALMAGTLKGTVDNVFSQIVPSSGPHRFDVALRGLHESRRR